MFSFAAVIEVKGEIKKNKQFALQGKKKNQDFSFKRPLNSTAQCVLWKAEEKLFLLQLLKLKGQMSDRLHCLETFTVQVNAIKPFNYTNIQLIRGPNGPFISVW